MPTSYVLFELQCRTAHLARLLREGVVLRERAPSNRLQCTQAQNSVRKSGHPSQKKALAQASAFFNEICPSGK